VIDSDATEAGAFDARELFRALARRDVEYVTIGGIAIQAHGGQRLTQDLDVAIASSSGNLARLASALNDLDARILGPDGKRSKSVPTAGMLASSDQWHLITDHGPLDVLTLPAQRAASVELADQTEIEVGGVPVIVEVAKSKAMERRGCAQTTRQRRSRKRCLPPV
jgi:hypothetical protein